MELLSILVSAAVIGGGLWVIGFIRAARRQTINDRLRANCRRSE